MATAMTTGPNIRTTLPGPNAQRILAADRVLISSSYTRSYPLVAQRGRGVVIEDVDGDRLSGFLRRHRRHLDRTLPSRK